jgi:hypothetical protein
LTNPALPINIPTFEERAAFHETGHFFWLRDLNNNPNGPHSIMNYWTVLNGSDEQIKFTLDQLGRIQMQPKPLTVPKPNPNP